MKEKLYTIPMIDALKANDECPFCFIEKNLEQHALDFVLGPEASYMQKDVRMETDKIGFCAEHLKKMFQYGNSLGNALILETHLKRRFEELKRELKSFHGTAKVGFLDRIRKDKTAMHDTNNVSKWIHEKEGSCYVCSHIKNNYDRYLATFFVLFKKGEPEFIDLVKSGKGVCFHHLADILDRAPVYLDEKEQKQLRDILFPQMEENVERILEELDWFQKKFDYRFRNEDWKTSKDAVQRTMQKIAGGYPAEEPYRQK